MRKHVHINLRVESIVAAVLFVASFVLVAVGLVTACWQCDAAGLWLMLTCLAVSTWGDRRALVDEAFRLGADTARDVRVLR